MTIHIRQFSIDAPATMQTIRTLGETEVIDAQGNRLCTSGLPEHYVPCFDNVVNAPDKSDPLTIARITSWPLAFTNMKIKGKNPLSRPPSGCIHCCQENQKQCLKPDSCIFSVCNTRYIRPQFVFIGKNWSADIVNHQVDRTCWGNGNNVQAKHLRDTIFEGGYFTDFVKGYSKTNFADMGGWLLKKDPLLGNRIRFDVFLEIFEKELELLSTHFNLKNADKYIVIWGVTIFDALNYASQKRRDQCFADLKFFKDNNYEIRMFGAHYTPQGQVLNSLHQLNNSEIRTIRRIYKTVQERQNDNDFDHHSFDFEIMPEQRVLLPDGNEEQIVWLA